MVTAATRLFAEKGFEHTSTRDIARAAGVSYAALYYYFKSKESLLYEILLQTLTGGLEKITAIYQSEVPLEEKLAEIIKIYGRYYADGIHEMTLLVHDQKSLSDDHKQEVDKKQRAYLDVMVQLLNDLKAQGKMADLDPTVCAFAFFGMVHWAYRWYDPERKIRPAELADIFNHIFTEGIYSGHGSRVSG